MAYSFYLCTLLKKNDMLDIYNLMVDLSQHRPIFHSEADFQHALAWQIHETMPDCKIRLEWPYRKERNWYLDIWLSIPRIAIELKFATRKLECEQNGEHFSLRDQSAQDVKRYDFLKDIQRLEQVVMDGNADTGFAVLLTNDHLYWQEPTRNTTDADFRLHDGRKVAAGKLLRWSENTSEKTQKGREKLCLKGSYHLHWKDYGMGRNPQFRYLAVLVK